MTANANLNDLVLDIQVLLDAPSVTRAGFGTVLIAGPNFSPGGGELIQFFTSLAATVSGTGLTTSSPEYRAAREAFAQGVRRIAIGRLRARVAQVQTITVTTAADGVWTVTVDGTAYTFTASGSATANAIAAGLRSALGSAPGVTVTGSSAQIILTANVAGVGFTATVTAAGAGASTNVETTANRAVADELDAVRNENGDWFGLVITSRVAEDLRQTAAWAETARRLYVAQTADAAVLTTATDDIASELQDASRAFTAVIYHASATEYADAAWCAKVLSFSLETTSPTWAFHSLSGVIVDAINDTQRDNAIAKNCNVYLALKGQPSTWPGKVASGKFVDEIVIAEWFRARLEEDVAQALINASARGEKIPYTDEGFAVFESILRRRYAQGVTAGHFVAEQLVATFPRRSEIIDADATARVYRWSASIQLAGAVHSVESTIYLTVSTVVTA
jgi:hypothetical protein